MMRQLCIVLFLVFSLSNSLAAQQTDFIYVDNGRLYHPDGREVALYGVNLQPCLSWEYNARIKKVGLAKDADLWKKMTDKSLDELELMGSNYIRVHLTPADYTDAEGNLVQTIYLDLLDYMTAEAAKRGMYTSICFLNHMGSYEVQSSFMVNSHNKAREISQSDSHFFQRTMLRNDPVYLAASKNYITNLLNRTNPYNNTQYKADTSMVAWEIMNEPVYLNYTKMKLYEGEYTRYKEWLTENNLIENGGVYYTRYRKAQTLRYINEMHDVIRNTGAPHPVVWNLNWNNMRKGFPDVFEAAAESKAEVVAFCNYPGQGIATQNGGGNYQNNTEDLTRENYSDWYKSCYNDLDWYGWALSDEFKSKAKVVYEFETFYNQSGYLYPAQANFFRAVGVQAAAMWHYSMPDYAPYNSGSHILNLKCTPRKAASFAVASNIFRNTPILQDFNPNSPTENLSENYMFSYARDMALYSDSRSYCYSNTIDDGQLPTPMVSSLENIVGIGNSPLVKYDGTGSYQIFLDDDSVTVHIQPDVNYLHGLWERHNLAERVTELISDEQHTMKLDFLSSSQTALYKVEDDGTNTFVKNINPKSFSISPGIYKMKNNMNTGFSMLNLSDELKVYPNPTTQKLHIVNGFDGQLSVFSFDGRKAFSASYRLGDTINLSTINTGVYVLVLSGNNMVSTEKFVKIE